MQVNLHNELNKLKIICDSPRLYLANYFNDLRTQVDVEIVTINWLKTIQIEKV